jgi:hypothetical protein
LASRAVVGAGEFGSFKAVFSCGATVLNRSAGIFSSNPVDGVAFIATMHLRLSRVVMGIFPVI